MMQRQKTLPTLLSAALLSSLLAACAPTSPSGPAAPNTTLPANGQQVNNGSNANGQASANTSVSASAELQQSLQAVIADDMAFADAQTATEGSFRTQALGIEQRGDVSATSFLNLETETDTEFTRSVTRSVTFEADGSRKVVTSASSSWGNGRKHERSEERVVSADGSAIGSGSLTITEPDGTVKTRTYELGVSASGQTSVESEDPDTGVEVTVIDSAESGEVTVIVEDDGASTELSVDLSEDSDTLEAEVMAEAEAAVEAEA